MKSYFFSFCLLIIPVFLNPGIFAHDNLTNPYDIMNDYIKAVGGLEKLKAETSSYTEGTLTVASMEGTFKNWKKIPQLNRTEVDLKVFTQTSGDNGRFNWVQDANGKVQVIKDENTMKRREINRLSELYEYLNPDSRYFRLSFEGHEKINDSDCYIVKIANTINDDITLNYINSTSFLLVKTINKSPDNENHTVYSDFRDINGIKVAFHQESVTLPLEQKQSIQLTKYISNLEIDPALFEPPGEDVKDYEFTDGENAENIPFMFIENHLYIMVNIRGKERMWCLDTGAGMSVIDTEFARELGLKLEGELKGQGAGQHIDVTFTTLPEYSLKGIRFSEQKVAAIEVRSIFKKWGLEVDGILGYDFLSRFIIKVDYANELLSFYSPDNFKYTGFGVVLDAPLVGNTFSVPATVDGKYSGQWSVDLGAGSNSFHYPFAEKHEFIKLPSIERLGMGAGGTFQERMAKFKTIELAGFVVREPLIDFPLEKKGAFRRSEEIGNLGNSLFRHFILYLDYKDQRMIIEKGADFDRGFPTDKSGLQLVVSDNDEITVLCAPKNTPAGKAGIIAGDVVKTINDIDVKNFKSIITIREMFKEKAGTTYKIGIMHEGQPKEIKLTLNELL
ncbi:MAG: aspartyl protease family protein [candidate division Zixibacteria bacterium]|nr:aspartyl protease family protein [candidate division Zixibacteria bacterium]MDD5425155.1 aspartyl protease family protein [candidate division Zixibacteria bacterium]